MENHRTYLKMNFGIFCLVALSLPLLISCYFTTDSARSEMEIASQRLSSKHSDIQTNVYSKFIMENKYCISQIYSTHDNQYMECLMDETAKVKGLSKITDPKYTCCNRVTNYFCMKKFLKPKCSVTDKELVKHDDDLFKFMSDIFAPHYPSHCTQNNKQSIIKYCHNKANYEAPNNVASTSFITISHVILACILSLFY